MLFVLVALAGCGAGTPPVDHGIDMTRAGALAAARRAVADKLDATQLADYDLAVQELKFAVSRRSATDADDLAAKVAKPSTVRGVIVAGLELKLERLANDRDALKQMMDINAQMTTNPGDARAQLELGTIRKRQDETMQKNLAEDAATVAKLKTYGPDWKPQGGK